jgi:phosphate starvation-inducible PhoH-like protein
MKLRMVATILALSTALFPRASAFVQRPAKSIRKLGMKKNNPCPIYDYEFCKPKNPRQEKYINILNDKNSRIVFAIGPAGTGKTLVACNHAMKLLTSGSIEKVVITRPVVPVEEEEIGFLPGNINKKMDPWMRPILDIFLETYKQKELDRLIYDNIIEIAPLAFMRGRTFKNTFIIGDEMQNSTPNQMKMLLTRVGENSKVVVTGDIQQNDIIAGKENGLLDIVTKTKKYTSFMNNKYEETQDHSVQVIEFTNKHIERSKVVRKILDIYSIDTIVEEVKKQKTADFQRPYAARDTKLQQEEFKKGLEDSLQ